MKRWTYDDLDYPIAMWTRISNRTLPIAPAPREEPANDKIPPRWVFDQLEPSPRATASTATLRRVTETLFAGLVFPGIVFGILLGKAVLR